MMNTTLNKMWNKILLFATVAIAASALPVLASEPQTLVIVPLNINVCAHDADLTVPLNFNNLPDPSGWSVVASDSCDGTGKPCAWTTNPNIPWSGTGSLTVPQGMQFNGTVQWVLSTTASLPNCKDGSPDHGCQAASYPYTLTCIIPDAFTPGCNVGN